MINKKTQRKIKYCLERMVVDIRQHTDLDEWIANTQSGEEVYVRKTDYAFDKKRECQKNCVANIEKQDISGDYHYKRRCLRGDFWLE